jgi:ADP-ribosylglycohydrolase
MFDPSGQDVIHYQYWAKSMGNQNETLKNFDFGTSWSLPSRDQFVGAFWGMAIGDYVGAKVEGNTPARCAEVFKPVNRILTKGGSASNRESLYAISSIQADLKRLHGHYQFGQITDDTQLAREMGLSILESGQFNLSIFANRMARLYGEHKMVGAGPTTARAITRLLQGIHPSLSGVSGFGNGPVVRAMALGLVYCRLSPNDCQHLGSSVRAQSRITHFNTLCAEAALTYAYAISLLLAAGAPANTPHSPPSKREVLLLDVHAFICELTIRMTAASLSARMIGFMDRLTESLLLSPQKAALYLACIGGDDSYRRTYDTKTEGISGDAVSSLLWALYCFLKSPTDFAQILERVVVAGGDTDSTGALACALAGAYLGSSALPKGLVSLIDDQGVTGYLHTMIFFHDIGS